MSLNVPTPVSRDSVDFGKDIFLVSCAADEKGFAVPRAGSAKYSSFLSDLIKSEAEDAEMVIPVNEFDRTALAHVAGYLIHFSADDAAPPQGKNLPRPFPGTSFEHANLTPYERALVTEVFPKPGETTDLRMLITLTHIANFLQIAPLLSLCGLGVALHLKGKKPDEIKELMAPQLPLRVTDA